MIRTRKERTKVFREQIEHEWTAKFWRFIENQSDKPWSWNLLSSNPNITFDNVLAHPDKPWNWYGLSQNPNITFDIVLAHPDKSWNWGYLSGNQNITFDNVLAYPDKTWNWIDLSQNTFSKAKQRFINKRYKEHLSAYRIQQYWNRAISIPTNPICKRKQKRDYEKCYGRLFD